MTLWCCATNYNEQTCAPFYTMTSNFVKLLQRYRFYYYSDLDCRSIMLKFVLENLCSVTKVSPNLSWPSQYGLIVALFTSYFLYECITQWQMVCGLLTVAADHCRSSHCDYSHLVLTKESWPVWCWLHASLFWWVHSIGDLPVSII